MKLVEKKTDRKSVHFFVVMTIHQNAIREP